MPVLRQYIPNFAGIATALTDSLAKDKLKGQKGVKSKRVHKFIPTGPISLTEQAVKSFYDPVSYTHLTLPTKRIV